MSVDRLSAALADRYRIERELGAGGMATVYLAHDVRHDRKVAIKVLKPELAAVLGAERFVGEIRTTASLQHPHILPLFDSGTADGFLFYVMPYIRGETIREKLNRETQLPVDEAVRVAREVADALDYAHRHGVIHRDIKPENVLLHDGRAMVMDFGIALAVSAAGGGRMTETGLSLGTPHYMSPEQATADKDLTPRSDVYSLATVLYEMLAGVPPHDGGSAQQVIMKIITEPAPEVSRLRKSVPPNVTAAVARALEKVPADRFDSARAFAAALADPHFTTSIGAAQASVARPRDSRSWLRDPRTVGALAIIAVLAAALAAVTARSARTSSAAVSPATMRFTIATPEDSAFVSMSGSGPPNIATPVVSPDDRYVAFTVSTTSGVAIYLRPLDSFELISVTQDQRGGGAFFSPDGTRLGYLQHTEVWTYDIADRTRSKLGSIPEVDWDISSAAWHQDGRVLVTGARGLWAIPVSGGDPTLLLASDTASRERFDDVAVLPDGRILVNVLTATGAGADVLSANAGNRTEFLRNASRVRLVDDIVIFTQSDQVRASRVDRRAMKLTGTAVTLPRLPANRVGRSIAWSGGDLLATLEPVWGSTSGTIETVGLPVANYRWPRVSPDGRRIAIGIQSIGESKVRVVDLDRRSWAMLDGSTEPVWTPDSRSVIQSLGQRPNAGLLMQIADGSRPGDTLMTVERGDSWPTSVSPDGAWLAWYGATMGTGSDSTVADRSELFFMELATRQNRRLSLAGGQRAARFSPDGRLVAYQSAETGPPEIHVRPWPALDARYVVSAGEGEEPAWSPDGKSLYFRRGNRMMTVSITYRDGVVESSVPRQLFDGSFRRDVAGDQSYDVAPDGRFLMLRPVAGGRPTVEVTLNWINEVRTRIDRVR